MKAIITTTFAIFLLINLASCTDYGELVEHNKGQVYYKDPVTKQQADELGKYLEKIGYFDGVQKSVQLLKDGEKYAVNFVVKEGAERDPDNVVNFTRLSPAISYGVFDGAIVNLGICDEYFKILKFIPGFNFGKRLQFGSDELFYEAPVTKELATTMGEFLRQSGFFQGAGLQAQLRNKGGIYEFRYVILEGVEKDESYKATVRAFAILLSTSVLNNERCDIHMCNKDFKTLATVTAE